MIRLKISKYRLYRRRFLRPRRHFLAFFKIHQKIQLKTRQHFKNRINPLHQNFENTENQTSFQQPFQYPHFPNEHLDNEHVIQEQDFPQVFRGPGCVE